MTHVDGTGNPITPETVEARLGSGHATALFFTAPWCTAAILLLRDVPPTHPAVPLVAVDVEAYPHLADRFQIKSLPTLLVMQRDREQGRLLGAFSTTQIVAMLNAAAPTEARS